jgi:thioredoxin reductase
MMPHAPDKFDAAVVGGGPAGLSAALALGRATRRVLLASCGPPRNAPAGAAHNVFTRDGTPPLELIRVGREQLRPYDVTIRDECAIGVEQHDAEFVLRFESGAVRARGIVLATGVRDVLPQIPGFQELWGTGVLHCPYCHGWEVANRPLGIYARGDDAMHLSKLIRGWSSDVMLFTDGDAELSESDVEAIRASGILIRHERVQRLIGSGALESVILHTGEVVRRAALFVKPKQELRSDLPQQLGCAITAQGRVEADALGRTSVPRVYVAGDLAPGHQAVPAATATGALAGAGLNMELLSEEFAASRVGA